MSCGGNCNYTNNVQETLERQSRYNGGKNLVNNFNQRITELENKELEVSSSIIPNETETYDLGSNEKRFKDLYLSGNTIKLGSLELKDENRSFEVSNSNGNNAINLSSLENQVNQNTKNIVELNNELNNKLYNISFNWNQLGQDIEGELNYDKLGSCVSLSGDGNTMAVQVYKNNTSTNLNNSGDTIVKVYRLINNKWSQIGQDLTQYTIPTNSHYINSSISLNKDGTVLVIGNFKNDKNTINIYKYENESWINYGSTIQGININEEYTGYSVSVNDEGTIIAIGASNNDDDIDNDGNPNNNIGRVQVYQMIDDWEQLGENIYGKVDDGNFGMCVSLNSSGYRIAIGAYITNSNGTTYVYELDGNNWIQLGNDIIGKASGDYSGYSVSLSSDGLVVAIGAPKNDGNGNDSGQVRVYEYSDSNESWTQLGQDIDGEASGDNSGWSVSLSGDGSRVAIGVSYNDGNGTNSGHVRIYGYSNNVWTQLGQDIDGEASYDNLGISVSLSNNGTRIAIGASNNDSNGNTSGQVRVYQLFNSYNNIYISNKLSVNNSLNYQGNPLLYQNINEINEDTTIQENSSGIYSNTSNSNLILTLSSDTSKIYTLTDGSSKIIYTDSSNMFIFDINV